MRVCVHACVRVCVSLCQFTSKGDGYMVCGGVPEDQEDHAVRVAEFTIDMMETSLQVKDPIGDKNIQVNAGTEG